MFIPPINVQIFKNDYYSVNPVKKINNTLSFIDFNTSIPQPTSASYPTITPNIYQKNFTLNKLSISIGNSYKYNNNQINFQYFLYDQIKNELNKVFFNKITKLGELHRSGDVNFDISNISNNEKSGKRIYARLLNANNYIAAQGRFGPAQWIISNTKTYNYILSQLIDLTLNYNSSSQLLIGNAPYIINDLIDDDIILLGRQNQMESSGVHSFLLCDNNGNIELQLITYSTGDSEVQLYYGIEDIGLHPEYQFMKINTRSISYYRYKKLEKIKEIYNL